MNKTGAVAFYALFSTIFFMADVSAKPITLDEAIEKALNADPRISEKQAMVRHAEAQLKEAENSDGITINVNTFLGISPGLKGGLFKGSCGNGVECKSRDDRFDLADGLSPWYYLQYSFIKPLKTFGKIENFAIAAKHNIKVKEQDVRLQRGNTVYDVKKAYYGYITAHNSNLFLADIQKRIDSAIETIEIWLEEDEGKASQGDLYALQSASALAESYVKRAQALEKVALEGLKVLMGIPLTQSLELADKRLSPLDLPEEDLEFMQIKAMKDRPEAIQLEQGLKARRALVKAKRSMKKPNIYAGVAGMLAYSPLRDRIDNPHITDPFNDAGVTPLIGVQWQWSGGVQDAKTQQSQAELDALLEKNAFAQRGIPYQVSESYAQAQAYYDSTRLLKKSAKAARKWMIASYTDFEAGLEPVDKMVTAFQGYVLSYTEYLTTVYDYNMHVANLQRMIGDYQ
ncbi:MAG TPA: TolC family protein [Gammaproteobacteria bacterium]|nr:TolC family protein [Gammaproteobacteria bacterium]